MTLHQTGLIVQRLFTCVIPERRLRRIWDLCGRALQDPVSAQRHGVS